RFVNSRLWEFFVNMILMVAIGLCIGLVFGLIGCLLIGILAVLLGGLQDITNIIIYSSIVLVFVIITFTGTLLWIGIRFYLVDVSLAIENDVNGSSTINRSWELTKGNVGRIFLISLIVSLITIPIQFIISLIFPALPKEGNLISTIFSLLLLGLIFVGSALILPFLQTVKAVVYYDLRSRHEGLGLQLRNHDI
ncbi:MAG: DUF975 domain-containing protein, partial [Dolichospermum sp.]